MKEGLTGPDDPKEGSTNIHVENVIELPAPLFCWIRVCGESYPNSLGCS